MTKRYVYDNEGRKIEKTHSDDRRTVLSKNVIIRTFAKKKMDIAIKFAKLKHTDIILDFGCGGGHIKRSNPTFDITGYDVNPEHTELKHYTSIRPTKIFAMDVLEHIPSEEIEQIFNNFKKMSTSFDLIVAIPTENLLSRKARLMLGKVERVADHITPLKVIIKILNKHFKLEQKMNFLTVTYIARYSHRERT